MTATKATKFFRAVGGITDGYAHHIKDDVFEASEALLLHWDRTGGVGPDGRVLYVEATPDEHTAHADKVAADEAAVKAQAQGSSTATAVPMSGPRPSDDLAGSANT